MELSIKQPKNNLDLFKEIGYQNIPEKNVFIKNINKYNTVFNMISGNLNKSIDEIDKKILENLKKINDNIILKKILKQNLCDDKTKKIDENIITQCLTENYKTANKYIKIIK